MSQYAVDVSDGRFRRDKKKALKKYHTIENDISSLFAELEKGPVGDAIPGFNRIAWKVRMAVEGHLDEAHGYRLIYHLDEQRKVITPLFFYAKSERVDINLKELRAAAKKHVTQQFAPKRKK